jgi:hypothetical protein
MRFCSVMNRLITVNSYTTLASILMAAIAIQLVAVITALLFQGIPLCVGEAPAIYGRGTSWQSIKFGPFTLLVGEVCCFLSFSTFRSITLSRFDPFPGLVRSRQRFV